MICAVCGRAAVSVVAVRRVETPAEGADAFGLCATHTALGELAGQVGEQRALREGARVGDLLVKALMRLVVR